MGLMPVRRSARRPALPAFPGEGERLLVGALGHATPCRPTAEPRVVHHREHAGEAAVFLADEIADRAALVAVHHGAGRRAVDAQLVLDAAAAHVVPRAQRSVGVDEELRHEEQRNAARARRRIGQARQHEVNDVVGQVVVAIGDVDLLAEDAVVAVAAPVRRACAAR